MIVTRLLHQNLCLIFFIPEFLKTCPLNVYKRPIFLTVPKQHYDIVIVGAGAAGLMAAASAAGRGKRVALLEKNKKVGVKILMSGGTRCNITHNCDVRGIIDAFGRNGKFLHSALASLPPDAVVRLIESRGVATKTESTGKIFPVSDRAIDVRDALVGLAVDAGAEIIPERPVTDVRREGQGFVIATPNESFVCPALMITSGGKSYPGCGTTGDGYRWAAEFGHPIVETFPALTPILSDADWARQLRGITIDPVVVQVVDQPVPSLEPQSPEATGDRTRSARRLKRKVIARQTGSFLFTHWGFSGPAVLDVSREVARHPHRKSFELVCDFLPSYSREQLSSHCLHQKAAHGKQSVAGLLGEFFPKRLALGLIQAAKVDTSLPNAELSKNALVSICDQVKMAHFKISGTLGFEKAEVTSGGVSLKEIDSKTMQSKIVPGLYFAGEVLDLDGRIGGYNFQSAFSTGWLAGQSV